MLSRSLLMTASLLYIFGMHSQAAYAATSLMSARAFSRITDGQFTYCPSDICQSTSLTGRLAFITLYLVRNPRSVDPVLIEQAREEGPFPFDESDANLSLGVEVSLLQKYDGVNTIPEWQLVNSMGVSNYDYINCPQCFTDNPFRVGTSVGSDFLSTDAFSTGILTQNNYRRLNFNLTFLPDNQGDFGQIIDGSGNLLFEQRYDTSPSLSLNFDVIGGFVKLNGFGAVPEPSTWAYLILGFGFVGMAQRRNSRMSIQAITGVNARGAA